MEKNPTTALLSELRAECLQKHRDDIFYYTHIFGLESLGKEPEKTVVLCRAGDFWKRFRNQAKERTCYYLNQAAGAQPGV